MPVRGNSHSPRRYNDPLEIENVIDEPTCSGQLKTLKHACIERFQLDGYTEPLDGDDWKRFPETRPPAQYTDDGLLFQDPEDLQKEIDSLGKYARSSKFTKDSRFDLLGKLCDVSQPKKKVF